MATRPPDFKASGIRTERIIASGSLKNPRLLIIGSGSTASDGVTVDTDTLKLSGTGSDTWLYVSGSRAGNDRVTFGGDLYLSGAVFGDNLFVSSSTLTIGKTGLPDHSDTIFYVTGTAGLKGSAVRGTSVFAGDLVVSGGIYNADGVVYTPGSSAPGGDPGSVQVNDGLGGFAGYSVFKYNSAILTLEVEKVNAVSLTGSLTSLDDGTPYLLAGTGISLSTGSSGAVTVATVGVSSNWNELSPSPRLNTTASVALAGDLGDSYSAESRGSDVFFFVSGTAANLSSPKRAVFGGDVYVSGNFNVGLNDADGYNSFAQGRNTWASGSYSHAIGLGSYARGDYSNAEGNYTIAWGECSHTEGDETKAYGMWSHAEGASSEASGTYSHAAGIWTIASGTGQSTVGKFNLRNNNYSLFVVGNGTNNSNRSDIFRVDTDSVQITGSLGMKGSILPNADFSYNLGSPTMRWQNVYTGDLHLRNDRGDWTVIEEPEFLTVTNNKTGKRFKILMEPLD